MKSKSAFLTALFLAMAPVFVFAQTGEPVMYSSGRIYVVIAVLLIILLGVFFYLFRLERKLRKLEKNN